MSIKLTTEKKKNRNGVIVDNSIYLERLDPHNLVLRRGTTPIGYFGDVRTAFKRALNYAIKGSENELTLKQMLKVIKGMDKKIDELRKDCLEED